MKAPAPVRPTAPGETSDMEERPKPPAQSGVRRAEAQVGAATLTQHPALLEHLRRLSMHDERSAKKGGASVDPAVHLAETIRLEPPGRAPATAEGAESILDIAAEYHLVATTNEPVLPGWADPPEEITKVEPIVLHARERAHARRVVVRRIAATVMLAAALLAGVAAAVYASGAEPPAHRAAPAR